MYFKTAEIFAFAKFPRTVKTFGKENMRIGHGEVIVNSDGHSSVFTDLGERIAVPREI